jgi:xanthine dehydrogenase small subunit
MSLAERGPWASVIDMIGDDFSPAGDARASAAYRLACARALLLKALNEVRGADSATTRVTRSREVILEHIA